MAQQKKGLITRLLEGREKSEEYARSTLPTNRWQLFWDIFKGNFGKLVKANLLMLLFFIPVIAVIVLYMMMGEMNALIYPFGANVGIGYPSAPLQSGLAESITLSMGTILYIGLFVTSFITALGLAGGMYVIRNMVWTEGIFVANDFWRGIKLNYKNALQTALFFTITFALCSSMINFSKFTLVAGNLTKAMRVWLFISQGFSYFILVFACMMTFWMIAMGVNYNMGFVTLLKNSLLLTIGTLPQTIFFGLIALLPFFVLLLNVQLLTVIAVMCIIFFAFSYALLVWLDFAQWVFDKYINPKIKGAKVNRGIYNRNGESGEQANESQAAVEYQRALLAFGKSRLVANPIKPIDDALEVYELPTAFTREDLKRLRQSKEEIAEDTQAYVEEHKDDARYVEYNKQFSDLEKSLSEKDEGKKKKRKPPKLLGE
jgi:hypothetical protein